MSDNLETWDDMIQAGANLAQASLKIHFTVGALANRACGDRKQGPNPNGERRTLGSFAAATGFGRSELSRAAADDEFYTPDMREELPLQVTPRLLHGARVGSGWKRAQGSPTAEQRSDALVWIQKQIEDPALATKEPPDAYEYVRVAREKLGRALERPQELKDGDANVIRRAKADLALVSEFEEE